MSERISLVDCTHKFEFEELDEEMRLIEKICDQQVRMICSKCLHLFTFDTEKAADPRLRQILDLDHNLVYSFERDVLGLNENWTKKDLKKITDYYRKKQEEKDLNWMKKLK